ncbi:sugar O-acyltransferase, sialic acid O-acetyltransferase NeuD family [Lachnospiraceae bacterium G41]|nr:sugar O-acyltransferase, sialic acid O-acetyltransferase NeuD family [Lachnospiraceae bacterium G41]
MTDLIIVGAGEHGRMMFNFFKESTDYNVISFAVEEKYYNWDIIEGIPVITVERLIKDYKPEDIQLFVAITFNNMNRERKRLYEYLNKYGFSFVSYIHPSSIVDKTVKIGENVVIMENNVVQYNVSIGNNVVVQAGGVIAHSTKIEDDVWIAPCSSIAGFVNIGQGSFIGINSTICNNLEIAPKTIIGGGSVIHKTIAEEGVYVGNPFRKIKDSSEGYFS